MLFVFISANLLLGAAVVAALTSRPSTLKRRPTSSAPLPPLPARVQTTHPQRAAATRGSRTAAAGRLPAAGPGRSNRRRTSNRRPVISSPARLPAAPSNTPTWLPAARLRAAGLQVLRAAAAASTPKRASFSGPSFNLFDLLFGRATARSICVRGPLARSRSAMHLCGPSPGSEQQHHGDRLRALR
jgi:hypothetical protein